MDAQLSQTSAHRLDAFYFSFENRFRGPREEIKRRMRFYLPLPVQNPGPHGFGRAIIRGLDAMKGDAVVIMMADESDDCRDVVRYWQVLGEG